MTPFINSAEEFYEVKYSSAIAPSKSPEGSEDLHDSHGILGKERRRLRKDGSIKRNKSKQN